MGVWKRVKTQAEEGVGLRALAPYLWALSPGEHQSTGTGFPRAAARPPPAAPTGRGGCSRAGARRQERLFSGPCYSGPLRWWWLLLPKLLQHLQQPAAVKVSLSGGCACWDCGTLASRSSASEPGRARGKGRERAGASRKRGGGAGARGDSGGARLAKPQMPARTARPTVRGLNTGRGRAGRAGASGVRARSDEAQPAATGGRCGSHGAGRGGAGRSGTLKAALRQRWA